MKVTILGAGAYALGLCRVIHENNNDITIWSAVNEEVDLLNKKRINKSSLNYKLPNDILVTNDLEKAVKDSDIIIIAVACRFISSVCKKLNNYYKKQHIVIASKGIEQNTLLFVHEIVESIISTKNIAVISGPSFAKDLILDTPTGLALGTKNKKTEKIVAKAFKSNILNIYPTRDILGVEICGAIKNVIAIGSGMLNGMGVSFSTKAMFLTDSMHQIKLLIKALGGNDRTVLSYAGFGDILLTCTSPNSRNYKLGELIGKNSSQEVIDDYINNNTIEGLYTLTSIYQLTKKKKISIPLLNLIYKIVYKKEEVDNILEFLVKEKD